ncbi:MAG TPA: MFS transporter [Marmoricola sp.]|nr:MFS transporter [Marmoricola sp.]
MDPDASPRVQRPQSAAYLAWAVGVVAYVMAIFNRTSFGVAVSPAAGRFHASAAALSAFPVVQLIVYALMQVPVGIMLDRWGSKRIILSGAVLMAAGQCGLALTHSLDVALVMRILIGAGDAMTFIPVLRVINDVFPGRSIPMFTQFTAILGQIGGVLSAFPLAAALAHGAWNSAFMTLAISGVLVAVLVLVALHVDDAHARVHASASVIGQRLRGAFKHPGTRLGLWSHFTTQFPQTVFQLLWGFPFMMAGEGLSRSTASSLLTLNLVAGIGFSLVLGRLTSRHPLRRSWLVLTVIGINVVAWSVVLAWPGKAPMWLLVLLVLMIACGPPGSMIGFDYARTFNPRERLGTASGIVNVGGFVASLLVMFLMGIVLDAVDPGASGHYSLTAFRWAFGVQYAFWAVGIVLILASRQKLRRHEKLVVTPLREALAARWGRR